ncbi:VOC family protein [Brevundimonas sp. A19_0]|uniref:VOC family protein n=1 Tax=Brevundimonas sp. A19_0 TaxID=2821087 RepID=UPI001ADAD51E|nr:VOC family protein [Brevundimonas sp. A19_0]MBO9500850.1 VOC family protein [Brevundimonas sp. A19_0]
MKIVTSLSFPGTCREAFEFYAGVLGGEITAAMPYSDAPPEMPVPERIKDWMMHCWLQVGDQAIMGSDMHPDFTPDMNKVKDGFDVTLHFKDVEEARRIFDALSDGGEIRMPFAASFWSPGFGGFTDKFGVPWMINTNPDMPQ